MWRWRRRTDEDFRAEIQANLGLDADRLIGEGMNPEAARAAARRAFGNVTATQERFYESRRVMWLDDLRRDIAYAWRTLVRAPAFTLVVVLTLGVGIGVNNMVFTFVNAILLRGLPFDQPDRIVSLTTEDSRGRALNVSRLDFYDWRDQARSFSGLVMFQVANMNVSDEGRTAEQFVGTYGTANLFTLVGARPLLGRDFRPEDDQQGAEPVAILSYGLWTNRYGSDPATIGRTIRVNSLVCTVIGVMPPDMRFPSTNDLWLPWSKLPMVSRTAPRQVRNFFVFGRLAPGVSLAQARTELGTIGARLAHDFPASNTGMRPAVALYSDILSTPQFRLVFFALTGAVAFVLLIACANVANLLLARASRRTREMAVRLSLGASRSRIVRQLLIESLVLAMVSGALGLGLSIAGVRIFDSVLTELGKPYWMTFTMDARVFAFLTALCLATGLIFGVAPALHLSKTDVHEVLKEAGGRSNTGGVSARRWTSALVIAEVALTIMLLAGAGFMMRSFLALYRMDMGIETSHLLTMRITLPLTKYPQAAPRAALYRRLEERLRGIREIEANALTTHPPLNGGFLRDLAVDGRPAPEPGKAPEVTMIGVSASYFDTVGARLLRGRELTDVDDVPGHVGVIVDQRFVSVHFPTEDPIGRQITLTDPTPAVQQSAPIVATIVGVTSNIRPNMDAEPGPVVYLPYQADPQRFMLLVVRTQGEPGRITSLVRDEMRAVEPDVPLYAIETMDTLLANQRWSFRVFGSMFAIFAVIALGLSAVGLYAVTAYSVTQRTPEIGVRMALGAQPGQVLWLILRRALWQLAIALPIGVAGAFAVGQLLQSLLVQTSSYDPLTIVSITGLMILISLAACLVPARRATRLDPLSALRDE